MTRQPTESNPVHQFLSENDTDTNFDMLNCYAVILTGGEVLPRQKYIPKSLRRQRPPQFRKQAGEDFLINQTRNRIDAGFPSYKTFLTVTEKHSRYYEDILADVPLRNLIVQPQDAGTTFEILYAAQHFAEIDPSSIIVFFPMNFSPIDNKAFMAQVESACMVVSQKPQLILMGIESETLDSQLDWFEIDQAKSIDPGFKLWRMLNFWHNPSDFSNDELENGAVVENSSIMIGTASTILDKIRRAAPDIYANFVDVQSNTGKSDEEKGVDSVHRARSSKSDLSKDIPKDIPKESKNKSVVIPASDVGSAKTKITERPEIVGFVS